MKKVLVLGCGHGLTAALQHLLSEQGCEVVLTNHDDILIVSGRKTSHLIHEDFSPICMTRRNKSDRKRNRAIRWH